MVTTIRAAISVVMLAGFYLLAVGIIGALAAATYWAFQEGVIGAAVGKLAYLTGVIALGLIVALWKVFRAKPEPPEGVALAPSEAPELFSTVADLAGEVGTRAPDEIRLIGDVNAAVAEDSRLFGLIGGRRYLYLGLPLLQAFNSLTAIPPMMRVAIVAALSFALAHLLDYRFQPWLRRKIEARLFLRRA